MSTRLDRMSFAGLVMVLVVLVSEASATACTGFLIGDEDTVLVGNNEDWRNPNTLVRFVPASEGKYGRVYFGFDEALLQGGMNDQGLCFDGFATAPNPVESTSDLPAFRGNPVDEVMASCATVGEVVALFKAHDRRFLKCCMLFFGDATGDAVIIEGDAFVRKKGRFQVVTNFYQSETEEPMRACRRYRTATLLLARAGAIDVDLCRGILDATHAEGPSVTLYSNVYDLKKRLVYLYHFHDFDHVVVLDLEKELARGARTVKLPDLFPRKAAEAAFREDYVRAEEGRRAALHPVKVPADALERLAGSWRVVKGEIAMKTVDLVVEDGRLYLTTADGGRRELIPLSATRFVILSASSKLAVTFENDPGQGPPAGFVVEWDGGRARGERIE